MVTMFSSNQKSCKTIIQEDKYVLFRGIKRKNIYKIKLYDHVKQEVTYVMLLNEEQWMWHKTLGHTGLRLILKFKLVRDFSNLKHQSYVLCEEYKKENFWKLFSFYLL